MEQELEKQVIRMSVRNLVEFIFRSGDIDSRRRKAEQEAMAEGARIHRKIQRSMGGGYQAEVSLKWETEMSCAVLRLEGRADGIFQNDGCWWIDEIKGMYRDVSRMEAPFYVHQAQAMCYAWIYGQQHDCEKMGVQMTYVNLETEEKKYFRLEFSMGELENWFQELAQAYEKWAVFQTGHRELRDRSIKGLEFPYPYREGQRELAVSVYRCIQRRRNLLIQAATGIGKTLSVLFPSIKAVGEGLAGPIFYLTAKTITRTVAEEGLNILRRNGLLFSSVTLTAKEKICPLEQTACNPDACPRAKGHFDRVNEAVYNLIHHESFVTRQKILDYSEQYSVCPFELSLDVSEWVDMVICDYNYVFDPDACLRRFFGEGVSGDYLFLVDEAHNLADRAREMYSASIDKEDFLEARKLVKDRYPRLGRLLNRCNQLMLQLKRECDDWAVVDQINQLSMPFLSAYGELEKCMEDMGDAEPELLEFYFKLRTFLNIWELADDHYRIYTAHRADGRFMVKLLCVNPASNLEGRLSKGISAIFFSATMLPVNYYKELLTGNQEEYAVYARSPFPADHRLICAARDVSSRYSRRGHQSYQRVWQYIRAMAGARKGNYLVFFPSYQFMSHVAACGEDDAESGIRIIAQNGNMNEEAREAFLEYFREPAGETIVGFCVMGGIFSEGIDLKGEALIGAAVVGTGLPQISTEREIIRQYYDAAGKNGFDYAYRFPGMNKVLQAAGRVIRTDQDRGVILLLDDRFGEEENRVLFPREWEQIYPVRISHVKPLLEQFWNSGAGSPEPPAHSQEEPPACQ